MWHVDYLFMETYPAIEVMRPLQEFRRPTCAYKNLFLDTVFSGSVQ